MAMTKAVCAYCGVHTDTECEHVVPESFALEELRDSCQWVCVRACSRCNRGFSKGGLSHGDIALTCANIEWLGVWMQKETAMNAAGVRGFFRGIKRSVIAAAVLLAWDGVLSGSFLMSMIFCPIWFLVSLLKNAIERPGWGLALVRIGIPVWTLGLASANNAVQLGVAEANSQRVVAACEQYHAANGTFPKNLDELVPQYLNSVPVARYCLGPSCRFYYSSFATPMLYWQVVPPHLRKIYNFETRSWSYLD